MRKIKNIGFLLVIYIISICSCKAQVNLINTKINVVDEKHNNIPEVKIKLSNKDTTLLSQTNLDGVIEFKGIKKGKYKLDVSSIGNYTMSNISIKLKNSEEKIIIEMVPVQLGSTDIEWSGGWVTFEDKNGNVKSIRSKRK